MSDSGVEKVSRYCPECGRRFTAPEQQFREPRVCPGCKTRVLFLEYHKELPPDPQNVDLLPPSPQAVKYRKYAIALIAGGIATILLAMVAAALTGNFNGFLLLSFVALTFGIVGASVFLESSGKQQSLRQALLTREGQLRKTAEDQIRYLSLYQGMKRNMESLLAEEQKELEGRWQDLIQDAEKKLLNASAVLAEAEISATEQKQAIHKMAQKMLSEIRKSIKSKLNATNFATSKDRFMTAVAFCEKQGYAVPPMTLETFLKELQSDYEQAVRTQLAKEEQAAIREKMREEAKAERELATELAKAEAEQSAIKNAIAHALARAAGEHSAEVEALQARLAEAEARSERAMSMAQMTKAGNVYVISNMGSFGENVFKIGMTRRLEPMDRVKELGDASVPFPFDVHMMISSENAPALEATLHREFHNRRVNRVNFRKEFFAVSIEEISLVVERECGSVEYVIDPDASEYRESLTLSAEDFAFISSKVDPEALTED